MTGGETEIAQLTGRRDTPAHGRRVLERPAQRSEKARSHSPVPESSSSSAVPMGSCSRVQVLLPARSVLRPIMRNHKAAAFAERSVATLSWNRAAGHRRVIPGRGTRRLPLTAACGLSILLSLPTARTGKTTKDVGQACAHDRPRRSGRMRIRVCGPPLGEKAPRFARPGLFPASPHPRQRSCCRSQVTSRELGPNFLTARERDNL